MIWSRIGTMLALVGISAYGCVTGAVATASGSAAYAQPVEEPMRLAGDPGQKIRVQRTKAKKLEQPVSKDQPIYVRLLEAEDVEYLGKHWTSGTQKQHMKEMTLKRIRKRIQDDLLYKGFVNYGYDEATLKNSEKDEEPILLEIHLEKLRYGRDQHLASVSVNIHKLYDPTFVYGTFTDAGRVNLLSHRIAQRFALSTDQKK